MQKTKVEMDVETQKNIDTWLKGAYDDATKNEIRRLQRENPGELIDAFYKRLSFGTGGLRGIMGVGSNRMNVYTIQMATQGLANYINKEQPQGKRQAVLIGYDCRNHSREFAEETARVFAGNNIDVYLYTSLRPVALISFGMLLKKCTAAVMITASHNPPKYNGYKVYWSHGGQVLPPQDQGIIEEVDQLIDPSTVKMTSLKNSLIHEVDEEIDSAYINTIHDLQLHPGDNQTHGKKLHVVYTNLHGGGITMIPRVLTDWGFSHLFSVHEQEKPDGNFPTIKSPNPEEPEALKLGISYLEKEKGDLLLASDPDVDRLAVVVMHHGNPVLLTGNQIACIALEHLCHSLVSAHQMPPKAVFVKTIVTTELFRTIVEHYKAFCVDVLTGFKYIGEKIASWDEEKNAGVTSHHFIFGGEESFGYLYGTHSRDKDAVVSAALICEAALQAKMEDKTLVDRLYSLYQKYGIYREKLISLSFEGKEGAERIQKMMAHLRKTPPRTIGEVAVSSLEDYLTHTIHHLATGHREPLVLPKSDVLRFWLVDGTKIVVRPSGTEPKIKIYCGCIEKHHHKDNKDLEKSIKECDQRIDMHLNTIKKMLT